MAYRGKYAGLGKPDSIPITTARKRIEGRQQEGEGEPDQRSAKKGQ